MIARTLKHIFFSQISQGLKTAVRDANQLEDERVREPTKSILKKEGERGPHRKTVVIDRDRDNNSDYE